MSILSIKLSMDKLVMSYMCLCVCQAYAGFCILFEAQLNTACWLALPPQACAVERSPRTLPHVPPLHWVRDQTTAAKCPSDPALLPASLALSALLDLHSLQLINPEMPFHPPGKAGPWRGNVCVFSIQTFFALPCDLPAVSDLLFFFLSKKLL